MTENIELARSVAPEDLKPGDVIAVLSAAQELVPYGGCEQHFQPRPVVHTVWMSGDGHPLRVEAMCLPFVLVSTPSGEHTTLDVRRCVLVRLSECYAAEAFKRLASRPQQPGDDCVM
jgi:hypothetical protein